MASSSAQGSKMGVPTILDPEPPQFCDDEPLPASKFVKIPPALRVGLPRIIINATPKCPFVTASSSLFNFGVVVRLKAPSMLAYPNLFSRAPVDLVVVIDTSESTNSSKLDLVKNAVEFVIDNLGPSDRLSVVSLSTNAERVFPLRRMTDNGQKDAKRAVASLAAEGSTNFVEALTKAARVLEERHNQNPVASIIFLSDGRDTCYCSVQPQPSTNKAEPPVPEYLELLPASIYPKNRVTQGGGSSECRTFPIHAFGLGSDHDPFALFTISCESGGTYSFVESHDIVQDAIASCIGGLLTVVAQELHLTVSVGSREVQISSIYSGQFDNRIFDGGRRGDINIGNLYADEQKEFMFMLSIPYKEESRIWTSLLAAKCSYSDTVSKKMVVAGYGVAGITRPVHSSREHGPINVEFTRQQTRARVTETFQKALQLPVCDNNISQARELLTERIQKTEAAAYLPRDDALRRWLLDEMIETRERMANQQVYDNSGRAYGLANVCCHATQRATTRGHKVPGAADFEGYVTLNMVNMVKKSKLARQRNV